MRDLNGDGIITYRDLLLLLQHIFFVPGNLIINWCHNKIPSVAQFLELVPDGTVALLISLMVWGLAFLFVIGMASSALDELIEWDERHKEWKAKRVQRKAAKRKDKPPVSEKW